MQSFSPHAPTHRLTGISVNNDHNYSTSLAKKQQNVFVECFVQEVSISVDTTQVQQAECLETLTTVFLSSLLHLLCDFEQNSFLRFRVL